MSIPYSSSSVIACWVRLVRSVSLKSPRFFLTINTALATASMLSPTPEEYTFLITLADCSAACPVSPK